MTPFSNISSIYKTNGYSYINYLVGILHSDRYSEPDTPPKWWPHGQVPCLGRTTKRVMKQSIGGGVTSGIG